MALVGKKAPIFQAPAVINGRDIRQDFSLDSFLGEKEVLFFFYPKDFTFVCPTELIAFQNALHLFEARGVAVVGCSTDTEETHLAWLHTPRTQGGITGVTYPLVADVAKTISTNYGVLAGTWEQDETGSISFAGQPIAYRGTFFIDKQGIVQHESINAFSLGRNIQELLRIVDMWHHVETHGEVCPADWTAEKEAMQATPAGVASYLTKNMND
jgi:peroxiredoxin (alkyl hydroperoxide reductase subunit C)